MKETTERLILSKEDEIKKLNMDIKNYLNKLKGLTFNEFEIEDYVVVLGTEIKKAKDRIHQLQFEVYELMQILKAQ